MHLSCQNVVHYLNSKLLQAPNVDGSFLGGEEVAAPHTEFLREAHHLTRQPHEVVRQDGLGRSIVVLIETNTHTGMLILQQHSGGERKVPVELVNSRVTIHTVKNAFMHFSLC